MPPGGFRAAGSTAASTASAGGAQQPPQRAGSTNSFRTAQSTGTGHGRQGEMSGSVSSGSVAVGAGGSRQPAPTKSHLSHIALAEGCRTPRPFTQSSSSYSRPRTPLVSLPPQSAYPIGSGSSSSTHTSATMPFTACGQPIVTSSHFSSARPAGGGKPVVPSKRPSPSSLAKGKGRAVVQNDEEEVDELEGDENLDPLRPQFQSPAVLAVGGGGGLGRKKPRISEDSGFGETGKGGGGGAGEGEEEVEIPESENGDEGGGGGVMELEGLGRGGLGGGPGGAMIGGKENIVPVPSGGGRGELQLDEETLELSRTLLSYTTRRLAVMEEFLEIAESPSPSGLSSHGRDVGELRVSLSYIQERLSESRAPLLARGVPLSDLQIETEKMANITEELVEVRSAVQAGAGAAARSSNGNDEEWLRFNLQWLKSKISKLESQHPTGVASPSIRSPAIHPPFSLHPSVVPSPAAGGPSLIRPTGSRPFAPSLQHHAAYHASPSAPSFAASVLQQQQQQQQLASASASKPSAGIGLGAPPPPVQAGKASSTTSGSGSVQSATLAAQAQAQRRKAAGEEKEKQHEELEEVVLGSSSPAGPGGAAVLHPPPPRQAAAGGGGGGGFRAAGTSAFRPAAGGSSAPPAVAAKRTPAQSARRAVPQPPPGTAEVNALLKGVDFDDEGEESFADDTFSRDRGREEPMEESLEIVEPRRAPPPAAKAAKQGAQGASAQTSFLSVSLDDPPARYGSLQAQQEYQRLQQQQKTLDPSHRPTAQVQQHLQQREQQQQQARKVSSASDVVILDDSQPLASTSNALVPAGGKAAPGGAGPKTTRPWTRDVYKALRQRFGLRSFRANQEEAINATLSGKDVFVLLPTGGGKSLCFQLPAVISSGVTQGVTIVVSPLLSLISDQTKALMEKDIPTVFLNSTMKAEDKRFAMRCLKGEGREGRPMCCLAYVTPEQIVKSAAFRDILQSLHRREMLARFVIDEAHCVSSWGHDFRPDYKEMGHLKRDYPGVPLIALTATANSRVKTDVMTNLCMSNPVMLTQSFNRANLRYHVRKKTKNVLADIADFIEQGHREESGIVYCSSKKQCEETAQRLRQQYKIKAMHYHAGMDKNDRIRVQEQWQAGQIHLICATIAFGMGIDKADVRYVIHYSLSQSLEAYYQETGRAGRDGMNSVCVLFYAYGDTKLLMRLIDEGDGTPEQKDHNRANLRRVVQYCMNESDCRRSQVLQYFGENFPREMCHKTCDNCVAPKNLEERDVGELGRDAVGLVKEMQMDKGVTMLYAIDVFRGSKSQKIANAGHDKLPHAGRGSSIDRGDAERLFQLLAAEQILGERYERNGLGFTNAYVTLGPRAQLLLNGKVSLKMGFAKGGGKGGKGGKGAGGKEKGKKQQKLTLVNESYEHEEYGGEFVDELYDEEEGVYEDSGEVEWDDYGRRVVKTSTTDSLNHGGGDDNGQGGDSGILLAKLMSLREQTAIAEDCDPEGVISDKALQSVASVCPQNYREFTSIPGTTDEECEWWATSGGKSLCVQYRKEMVKEWKEADKAAAKERKKGGGGAAGGGSAVGRKAAGRKAAEAAEARFTTAAALANANGSTSKSVPSKSTSTAGSSSRAKPATSSSSKAPAKTKQTSIDLSSFAYKPTASSSTPGAGGKKGAGGAGGGGGGGGGIRPMVVSKR
ncbi:hypothetical protein JCM8547_008135 [Rhodosporidiobolus lusitaniae]